jgi:hypothetical protein
MYVTRISRYISRSVLSVVLRNRGRSCNVLTMDTGGLRYINYSITQLYYMNTIKI